MALSLHADLRRFGELFFAVRRGITATLLFALVVAADSWAGGVFAPRSMLARSADIKSITLPRGAGFSSFGSGRCYIFASIISRSAASYSSLNFSMWNLPLLRLMSSLARSKDSALTLGALISAKYSSGLRSSSA